MAEPDPTMMTLAEAQEWLRDRVDDGDICPCCTQHAQVYRRTINRGMAQALILMARAVPVGQPMHVPTTIGRRSAEEAKLALWGLVEPTAPLTEPGGNAEPIRGYWRVTPKGLAFLRDEITVPKYARVYNGRLLDFDETHTISIGQALGHPFTYDEDVEGLRHDNDPEGAAV